MLPSIEKARPWITARLRPRNINIQCCDWSQPRRHETRDFVTASVCVPDRHRHATGQRSDANTHLVSDKGHWIGILGMAQVTGEGKNAILRWHGVIVWLKEPFVVAVAQFTSLGRKFWFEGAFRSLKRMHPRGGFPRNRLIRKERGKQCGHCGAIVIRQNWQL